MVTYVVGENGVFANGKSLGYAERISKASKGKLTQFNLTVKFCPERLEQPFKCRQERQNTQENSQFFYSCRHTNQTLRYMLT